MSVSWPSLISPRPAGRKLSPGAGGGCARPQRAAAQSLLSDNLSSSVRHKCPPHLVLPLLFPPLLLYARRARHPAVCCGRVGCMALGRIVTRALLSAAICLPVLTFGRSWHVPVLYEACSFPTTVHHLPFQPLVFWPSAVIHVVAGAVPRNRAPLDPHPRSA